MQNTSHTDDDDLTIPDFLKIDDETRRKAWLRIRVTEPTPPISGSTNKYRLRQLKLDERRLSKLIDALGNGHNRERKRLYAEIHEIEKKISRLEN